MSKTKAKDHTTSLEEVHINGESFFKISNSDKMRPFFMSIVSNSDHWMFISSIGGLTAGRKNAEFSLFPYYTDDKITESSELTGSKSIFRVSQGDRTSLWEPFSIRQEGLFKLSRNLYKSKIGNKVKFEEINHDLGLRFAYQWSYSDQFGFVRTSELENFSDSKTSIDLLDGIQNILPATVGSFLQNQSSNLVDAYKRSQLDAKTQLGIFALSAVIVDKAEPAEALKANIAWHGGLDNAKVILSSLQLNSFRKEGEIVTETDVKAEKGAYIVHSPLDLPPGVIRKWWIIADVNKNHSQVAEIRQMITTHSNLIEKVEADVKDGSEKLQKLASSADGLQETADHLRDARHFSNTLFNIMRGGIFDDNYNIEKWDLLKYLQQANNKVYASNKELLENLNDVLTYRELFDLAVSGEDSDLMRLFIEYLPLKFSRRHGDPSRPWNRFSINIKDEDGSKVLDYEGNWRDIFQNWEALALSYPEFLLGMIFKFVNATTFDGYNPYRVTKGGFDWETIEPDDPWSYIGYWGDHQVIYLLKLLELVRDFNPGQLQTFFDKEIFVYANVPYHIKSYKDILRDPKDTITFEHEKDLEIRNERNKIGADGALLMSGSSIYKVNLTEKILAMLLAKLSNFIPEGGIWMNTQRPEWNDANNALVGNGVSMVTLYYLRRFLAFYQDILKTTETSKITISDELYALYKVILEAFQAFETHLSKGFSDKERRAFLDPIGEMATSFRDKIYHSSFSGEKSAIEIDELLEFVAIAQRFMEQSIKVNKRKDHLYHAYNLMSAPNNQEIEIDYLNEMLEGQVAVLSSGFLSAHEVLAVLDGMKESALFRQDQYSYLLYPNKSLPTFLEKNKIDERKINSSKLLSKLIEDGDLRIVDRDVFGKYHFNGNFKNASDLDIALDSLKESPYTEWVNQERSLILAIFEEEFNHKAFTGRSGTFYGYEGLGSIYWHMVSKFHLAVQECCLQAIDSGVSSEIIGRLLDHYYEIGAGIGIHKPPSLYGAFPTDPYSHTPAGKGAQQPGMTGQVKEDILVRFGELGINIKNGKLEINPVLLKKDEFLTEEQVFSYYTVSGEAKEIKLLKNQLAFTYCQIPFVYELGSNKHIQVVFADDQTVSVEGNTLDISTSKKIFARTGEIATVFVQINPSTLK